jgi:hypothetical protein
MSNVWGFQVKKWLVLGQRFFIYLPFRSYLVFFLIFSSFAQGWLLSQSNQDASLFNDILIALLKLIKTFFVPLILFAFLTTFIPFFLFWIAYRQRKVQLSLSAIEVDLNPSQSLQLSKSPLFQPLFGHLYFRLQYASGEKVSAEFSLIHKSNEWGISGKYQKGWFLWPIPGIKQYEVDKLIVTLEDFFHFFSFSIPVKANQAFATLPNLANNTIGYITPAISEVQEIRIDEWRKVQGEMLNYKSFDSSDDVRRIVWKIYARNKELVVRTPEMLNPYASHIEVLGIFYDGLELSDYPVIDNSCLDFYKTACFNIVQKIKEQGLPCNFLNDEQKTAKQGTQDNQDLKILIANSKWQQIFPPKDLGNLKKLSIVCVSSMLSQSDFRYLIENTSQVAKIYLVPLSKAAPMPKGLKWLNWMFVETEKDPQNRFPFFWFISPARRKLKKNEMGLMKIVKAHENKCLIFEPEK